MTVILDSYIDWMAMKVAVSSAAEAIAGLLSETSFMDRSLYHEGFRAKFEDDSREQAFTNYGKGIISLPHCVRTRRKLG